MSSETYRVPQRREAQLNYVVHTCGKGARITKRASKKEHTIVVSNVGLSVPFKVTGLWHPAQGIGNQQLIATQNSISMGLTSLEITAGTKAPYLQPQTVTIARSLEWKLRHLSTSSATTASRLARVHRWRHRQVTNPPTRWPKECHPSPLPMPAARIHARVITRGEP